MELLYPFLLSNPGKVPERNACDAKTLIIFLNREGDLGPVRGICISKGYVASPTDDLFPCLVLQARHECNGPVKVDFRRLLQLLL